MYLEKSKLNLSRSVVKLLYFMLIALSAYPITRPSAPDSITGVDFNKKYVEITLKSGLISLNGLEKPLYHAVLLRDLSISFGRALKEGTTSSDGTDGGATGPIITQSFESLNGDKKILVKVNPDSKARYFVGVCYSAVDPKTGERIYSPFRLWTDNNGMPLQVSTRNGPNAETETFYPRAMYLNGSKMLFMMQFRVDNPTYASLSVTYGSNTRTIGNLRIPAYTTATDIVDAIGRLKGNPGIDSVIIVRTNEYENTLFMLFNSSTVITEVSYKCLRTGTANKVISEGNISINNNYEFKNMVSTIIALANIPTSEVNPISYNGTLPSEGDNERLAASAILFTALAHNSPVSDSLESSQGIFSDHIQFMDNMVRKWGEIRTDSVGMNRISKILQKIFVENKGEIIDPVFVRNHGTLLEYGSPDTLRKNFAYCEGYIRLDCKIEQADSTNISSGAGIMFRISDNVEVTKANVTDTMNTFGLPFLSGSDTCRRIVITSNDSIFKDIDMNGIWVKGKETAQNEAQYYTGLSVVRLPLYCLKNNYHLNEPFSLYKESKNICDPFGTILCGPERSVFRVKEIRNQGDYEDTLENDALARDFLHRQKKIIEIDSNFNKNIPVKFYIALNDTDKNKVFLANINKVSAIVQDTSTIGEFLLGCNYYIQGKTPVASFYFKSWSRKLAFADAKEGVLTYNGNINGNAVIPIRIEQIIGNQLPNDLLVNGLFKLHLSDNTIKIFGSPDCLKSELFWPNSNSINSENGKSIEWNEFNFDVLQRPFLYVCYKYQQKDISFSIEYIDNNDSRKRKEEKVVIKLSSDYQKQYNNSLTKISQLCDCKNGVDKEACLREANKINDKFFEVWCKYANDNNSFGYEKGAPSKFDNSTRKSLNCYRDDIHSGWYCYQWAYHVFDDLSKMNLNYFTIQRSGYVADDGNTLMHNWVTIFVCNLSNDRNTDGAIHLDPWMQNAPHVFTNDEHNSLLGQLIVDPDGNHQQRLERNFISNFKNIPRTDLKGDYINENGDRKSINIKQIFRW